MRVAPSRSVYTVSKASRLTIGGYDAAQEQAGTACLLVRKASRLAFFYERAAKPGCSLACDKAGCLAEIREARRDASLTSWLISSFAVLMSLLPAFAEAAPGPSVVMPSGAPAPNVYVTVQHLGESEQQATAREGQLLSHRRATDPFGNTIRGPFKGLPPVVEHATPIPGPPTAATQAAATVNLPTLEKAIHELTIGALNVGLREILIGSRSIHEGDLLVLESEGQQFVVWVQSVGVHGVLFCDIDMQKHVLKPFGSGPRELPTHAESGISDIRNFLNKDAPP
jgi:hypothetical protein